MSGRATKEHDFDGVRHKAAFDWIDACRSAASITGRVRTEKSYRDAYFDFLAGFDHATNSKSAELLEENQELHGRLMDIDMNGMASVAEIVALRDLASRVACFLEGGEFSAFERQMLASGIEAVKNSRTREPTP